MILLTTLPDQSVRWLRDRLLECGEAIASPDASFGSIRRPGPRWNAASPTSHGFAFGQVAATSGRRTFLIQLIRDFEGARAIDVMRRDPGAAALRFVLPVPERIERVGSAELAALILGMAAALSGGPSRAEDVARATTILSRRASAMAVEAAATFADARASSSTLRASVPMVSASIRVSTDAGDGRTLPLRLSPSAAAEIDSSIGQAASLTAANGTYEIAALRATGDPSLLGAVETLRILAAQEGRAPCVAAR